jgi:exopolysaccharide production protein ExoY
MPSGALRIGKVQGALSRSLDTVGLAGAFAITSSIATTLSRSNLFIWPVPTKSDIAGWPPQYLVLFLFTLIGWNLVSGYIGIHHAEQPDVSARHLARLLVAGFLWVATTALVIFVFKLDEVSRLFVFAYMLLGGLLIGLRDSGERTAARHIASKRGIRRTAVVVGNGRQATWLRQFLLDNYCPEPYTLVQLVDPAEIDSTNLDRRAVDKDQQEDSRDTAEVFVAAADIGADVAGLFPRLFERANAAHIVLGIFDTSLFKLALGRIGNVPVMTLRSGALTGVEAFVKRALDFFGAAILLVVCAPLTALIAVLIKMSSPGPVFFRQERVGKSGKRIYIYKFRTMQWDAEQILEGDGELYRKYIESNYKLPKGEDPRITAVGRILRELSLDELPQLINVLKGEMSLVGPRPVVPEEIEKYGDYASLLLSVQPGLTGQWQVSGRSDIADYARRVRLDMEYIRDQSIARDLQILFRTLPVVWSKEGAH